MEHELALLSPEKTILTYKLASVGARIMAHLLDIIVIMVVVFAVGMLVGLMAGTGRTGGAMALTGYLIFLFTFPFLYFILFEGFWNGQTLGKKAAGIRVKMADGTAITWLASFGRNFLRTADIMPGTYFAGLMAMFTTPRCQRLGDLIANTVVVIEKRAEPRFSPAPHTAGIHPLEHMIGELRGMTLDEYNALRRYCDRFPEFPAPTQNKLTSEVWIPIARKRSVELPPNIHPLYLAEAVVMKYGREHGLL